MAATHPLRRTAFRRPSWASLAGLAAAATLTGAAFVVGQSSTADPSGYCSECSPILLAPDPGGLLVAQGRQVLLLDPGTGGVRRTVALLPATPGGTTDAMSVVSSPIGPLVSWRRGVAAVHGTTFTMRTRLRPRARATLVSGPTHPWLVAGRRLIRLTADGRGVATLRGAPVTAAAVRGDVLWVARGTGAGARIQRLDPVNGRSLGYETGAPPPGLLMRAGVASGWTSVALTATRRYVVRVSDQRLVATDLATGAVRAEVTVSDADRAAAVGDAVYLLHGRGRLSVSRLDPDTLRVLWSTRIRAT